MEAQGWWERLAAFAQGLDPDSGGAAGLRAAASAFIKAERHECAEACLRRLGDKQVPFCCLFAACLLLVLLLVCCLFCCKG